MGASSQGTHAGASGDDELPELDGLPALCLQGLASEISRHHIGVQQELDAWETESEEYKGMATSLSAKTAYKSLSMSLVTDQPPQHCAPCHRALSSCCSSVLSLYLPCPERHFAAFLARPGPVPPNAQVCQNRGRYNRRTLGSLSCLASPSMSQHCFQHKTILSLFVQPLHCPRCRQSMYLSRCTNQEPGARPRHPRTCGIQEALQALHKEQGATMHAHLPGSSRK